VGVVNWLLMIVTIALTILFQKSDNLAAAYGIAVSATMLMTSCLLFVAMHEIWHWPVAASAALASLFLLVDSGFFVANALKIVDGGYVPLLLAAVVFGVMMIWHRGTLAVARRLAQATVSVPEFLANVKARGVPRVPGTAVFITRATSGVPPVMLWHLQHNRALHERLLVLTVLTESRPRVPAAERLAVTMDGENFWRLTAQYGFMERPDIPRLLCEAHDRGCAISLDDLVYYVGHETIVHRERGEALPAWQEALFAAMVRNASHVTDYFRLPSRQVVEIGRQIPI
jgi:KUP system potassium uptake protein